MSRRIASSHLSQGRGRTPKRPGEGVQPKRHRSRKTPHPALSPRERVTKETASRAKAASPSALLKQLSAICLTLPEATREDHPGTNHATFRVRKKVFAYFLDNHHGDGIVSVCFKGALGEQADMIERDPKRYYSPDYIGPRGWIGYRLDVGKVSWPQVERHIRSSYLLTAPRTLARQIE